jgi:hypothetical protein
MAKAIGRVLSVSLLASSLTACGGGLVGIGSAIAGATLPAARDQSADETRQIQLSAEVREIDELQRRILVTTDDGRSGTVLYDAATLVVQREVHIPIRDLNRGDRIVVRARQDSHGLVHAERIDVQQPVAPQDAPPPAAPVVQEHAGTVSRIDLENGSLVLATTAGTVTLWLPDDAPQATRDYFRRLRAGDDVRLEAAAAAAGRLEIYRFL